MSTNDKPEALRQSQSLPAGAVAGLVGKWRATGTHSWSASPQANECADELEQALQADAREKGEAVAWRVQTPYGVGYTFAEEIVSYMNDRDQEPSIATQPAQASEDRSGDVTAHAQRAFKNCIRELRQIQDEAKDYDFDEMTVQALQTGIESIELRIATSSQETASE